MNQCVPINENDMARHVRKALKDYFKDLDGEEPCSGMYDMVIQCVEKPLIEMVLEHVGGNQPVPQKCWASIATPCARRCSYTA